MTTELELLRDWITVAQLNGMFEHTEMYKRSLALVDAALANPKLKPLDQLTDEDAIEIAKIVGNSETWTVRRDEGFGDIITVEAKTWSLVIRTSYFSLVVIEYGKSEHVPSNEVVDILNLLKTKGYDTGIQ